MNEFFLPSVDFRLFVRHWPCKSPRALVLLVHGMGTHSGRYSRTAAQLNKHGFEVYSYDQPGHGNTPGKRGHVSRYDELLDRLDDMISYIKITHPGKKIFLYGHSMGGNVVANYVLRREPDLAAVILSSPWLKLAFNPPFFKMMLAKFAVNIFPALRQNSKLNINYISHDKDVLKEYETDQLVHSYITPTFFLSATQAGLWALKNASKFHLPLYIYHGTDDRITLFSASKYFASKVKGAQFREWPGCYHEVHNEWVKEELYKSIIDFIEQQLSAKQEN